MDASFLSLTEASRALAEGKTTSAELTDQMIARMDIVSVNCPHTPATFHLLSARRLKQLRPQAYVVNTARGAIVDEAALIEGLKSGHIRHAGLDVGLLAARHQLYRAAKARALELTGR